MVLQEARLLFMLLIQKGGRGRMGRDDGRGDERAAFMCAKRRGRRGGKRKRRSNTRRSRKKRKRSGGEGGSTVKCALVLAVAGFTLVSLIF